MVMERLASLRADYADVVGFPFQYFFCPILWKDEEAELCRAHVVNKAFPESDRSWTIQRADVDNWFGSLFENDFLSIKAKDQPVIGKAFSDKDTFRRFRPRLRVDGIEVDYYLAHGPVPETHTGGELVIDGRAVPIGIKLLPSEFLSLQEGTWVFDVVRDVRLAAFVSTLKAAHLSMFHMLGYRYALSAGGRFVGKTILGDLYLRSQGKERSRALSLAHDHCGPYVNMVRPVIKMPPGFGGTVTDHLVHFFTSGGVPWAVMTFIRTSDQNHAAVLPIMDTTDAREYFHRFLESPPKTIEVRTGHINGGRVQISPTSQTIEWPGANFGASSSNDESRYD